MISTAPPVSLRLFATHADALSPIGDFLLDDELTEIMINGPAEIWIERGGQLLLTDRVFSDRAHLLRAIEVLAGAVGRHLDAGAPLLEGRLPDGSRLSVALGPVAVEGPLVTIRKFGRTAYRMEDLLRFGSLSIEAAGFLNACVQARANLVISGGSSSGKTTLLNVLSGFIPPTERIVTIEDAAELRLQQDHVCRLETIPAGPDGARPVTIRDLVTHAVRMRPDRIVVGEVRGGEALDMLQAMNTGHDGSLTTVHANSPRDALSRLETLVLMAGFDLPVKAVRQQMVAAIDLVVHLNRLGDGSRRISSITELTGMEDDIVGMQEIFVSEAQGARGGNSGGTRLQATGIRPRIMDRIYERRLQVPAIAGLFPSRQKPSPVDLRRTGGTAGGAPPRGERRKA